jgi:hypothetical protein
MIARWPATAMDRERYKIRPLIVGHQSAIMAALRKEQP